MNPVYEKYIKKEALPTLFCPGCGNGIIQMAAIHAIDKAGISGDVACVSGIGCSSWIPCYLNLDVLHTLHGRSLAFAQGLKLARPDKKVLVFTGDGDCLAIGGNHLIHSAARNIDLTVVMVNNRIYGMTGGQKSPSSLVGMKTKTSPAGNLDEPIDGCRLVEAMGATYVARWTAAHPVQLEHAHFRRHETSWICIHRSPFPVPDPRRQRVWWQDDIRHAEEYERKLLDQKTGRNSTGRQNRDWPFGAPDRPPRVHGSTSAGRKRIYHKSRGIRRKGKRLAA